jgi:aspartyl-tRNA(Asn)/glutamyl-tRNA(Gln) amidotransferase subunit A
LRNLANRWILHDMAIKSRRDLLMAGATGGAGLLLPINAALAAQPSDLTRLTLADAGALLRRKAISPVELTRACIAHIEQHNPAVNAFITVTADQALQQAREAEAQIQRGQWRGSLHGIPLALKDLIDTAGVRTTAASAVFKDRIPTQDAEVVRRLKAAGAVLLGKLNMHEFAFGGTSVPSHYGPVRNPWNLGRIAGGSSGGSAAAVAAGMCFGALGSDTAASVRHPAAYCGVVGLKPTFGRVSTRGVIPLSWSLDHIGPLCRTVTDSALLLEAIAGYDSLETSSVDRPVEHFSRVMRVRTARLRLGVVRRPYFDELDRDIEAAVAAAITVLEGMTAGARDVELPYSNVLMTIASAEAYAFHKPYFTQTPDLYQPMTRQRLTLAATISAADYVNARREMEQLRWQADSAFANVDLLITPTTALAPITVDAGHLDPPLPPDGTPREFRNTHMFDVLGLPAISVPCGFTRDGLPIGLQIAGPKFAESRVLALAHAYQQATDWHTRVPWPSNTTR